MALWAVTDLTDKIFKTLVQATRVFCFPAGLRNFSLSFVTNGIHERHTHQKRPSAMTVAEYNKCVDMHSDGLYRFLLKNVKDRDKAKDLVQETYAKLWMKVDEVGFEKAKSYIFTAGYHTLIDQVRRDKRHRDYRAEEMATNFGGSNRQYSDLSEVLNDALDRLPTTQKSVIMLRDYEGYSYEEIEKITGLNESQVKVYIYRARVTLKEYIGKMENLV
jgi:RNA polymerase sigma factor (sigma-70 family)